MGDEESGSVKERGAEAADRRIQGRPEGRKNLQGKIFGKE
jgi:hypothetical protein